jgi:alpha-D-ribose 1-methylphosphonate 5-triphosphate diphosphatase
MKDVASGLRSAEAEIAANGITTAVLAQFWSWEGGLRGKDFAETLFAALRGVRSELATDLRGQLRFETHLLDDYADVPGRLSAWDIGYLVFNDHLPHDRLAAGRAPKRLTGQALKAGRSPDRHLALMQDLHARQAEVPQALAELCGVLAKRGVRMGSHDDKSVEIRETWQSLGVEISEFPETMDAAQAAEALGSPVVMGAPNVVRGGSHNGNLSALDLVAMESVTALASDYHYPAMRGAVRLIVAAGLRDLGAAWSLVSSGPAAILGLEDRGALTVGRRADVIVTDAGLQTMGATIAGGSVSHMSGAVASRFLSVPK